MNNRERMRASNKMAKDFLLQHGYDDIHFKAHTARNDTTYTQKGNYLSNDFWNLFDGMCWNDGYLYFFQVKTNSWANLSQIKKFLETHNAKVLSFNVTNKLKICKGRWKVFVEKL